MSMKFSTARSIVVCCAAFLTLVGCSPGDVSEPSAETSPSLTSTSAELQAERADALAELAELASERATEMPRSPDRFEPGLERVADLFINFALDAGEADGVPVDTPVRLYLGNVYEKTISAGRSSKRDAWGMCANYADRSCPMSPVDVIAERGPNATTISREEDACLVTRAPSPTDTGSDYSVTIRPKQSQCGDQFAVHLYINDVGQITAVNLLLGTPS